MTTTGVQIIENKEGEKYFPCLTIRPGNHGIYLYILFLNFLLEGFQFIPFKTKNWLRPVSRLL
jgi:hypothetical protein